MSRLQRGLLMAAAGSLGVHLALVSSGWFGGKIGGPRALEPAVLVARMIDGSGRQTTETSSTEVALAPPVEASVEPAQAAAQASAETAPAPAPREVAASSAAPGPDVRLAPTASLPEATAQPPGSSEGFGLDRSPQPIDDLAAALPAGAGARGGSVTVRFVVSERGTVEKVTLLRSSTPGLIDDAALAGLSQIRFAPGLRGGAPTRSEVAFEIEFAAIGKGTDAAGRTY